MMPTDLISLTQVERDALACLGLYAHAFTRFDPPVVYPAESVPSHVLGLNIHAAIVDNVDGELLAIDRNMIHAESSPLQHGEQRSVRVAITRVLTKRPRLPGQAIEGYYRSSMFMGKGSSPQDYLNVGATLYTTLEPCPMCASTALVCRIKRVVFLLADRRYGGAWPLLKAKFYPQDESQYLELSVSGAGSDFADHVGALHARLRAKADELRKQGIRDTHLLDSCREELNQAFEILRSAQRTDLASVQGGDPRNIATLTSLQRALNMPWTSADPFLHGVDGGIGTGVRGTGSTTA